MNKYSLSTYIPDVDVLYKLSHPRLLCRLTPPLCLNFLGLIHLDSHLTKDEDLIETSYTEVSYSDQPSGSESVLLSVHSEYFLSCTTQL